MLYLCAGNHVCCSTWGMRRLAVLASNSRSDILSKLRCLWTIKTSSWNFHLFCQNWLLTCFLAYLLRDLRTRFLECPLSKLKHKIKFQCCWDTLFKFCRSLRSYDFKGNPEFNFVKSHFSILFGSHTLYSIKNSVKLHSSIKGKANGRNLKKNWNPQDTGSSSEPQNSGSSNEHQEVNNSKHFCRLCCINEKIFPLLHDWF